jgi:hypothetical protein
MSPAVPRDPAPGLYSARTVLETEPQSLAAHEIEALVREVLEVGA